MRTHEPNSDRRYDNDDERPVSNDSGRLRVAVPLRFQCRSDVGPMLLHCWSVAAPMPFRCRSAANMLVMLHCSSDAVPLQFCWDDQRQRRIRKRRRRHSLYNTMDSDYDNDTYNNDEANSSDDRRRRRPAEATMTTVCNETMTTTTTTAPNARPHESSDDSGRL